MGGDTVGIVVSMGFQLGLPLSKLLVCLLICIDSSTFPLVKCS